MTSGNKSASTLSQEQEELLMLLLEQNGLDVIEQQHIAPRTIDQDLALSFAQQRLWFLDQLDPGNPFYNDLTALRISGSLNVAALEQAIQEIVRRHEALRTTFTRRAGKPVQVIAATLDVALPVVDLRGLAEDERE